MLTIHYTMEIKTNTSECIWLCERMSHKEHRKRCQDSQHKIALKWTVQYHAPSKIGHRSPLCIHYIHNSLVQKKKKHLLSISSKKPEYETIFSLPVSKPSKDSFRAPHAHPYMISYTSILLLMLSFLWKEKYPARFMKTLLCSVCSQVLSLSQYLDDVMMMSFIS